MNLSKVDGEEKEDAGFAGKNMYVFQQKGVHVLRKTRTPFFIFYRTGCQPIYVSINLAFGAGEIVTEVVSAGINTVCP